MTTIGWLVLASLWANAVSLCAASLKLHDRRLLLNAIGAAMAALAISLMGL